MNHLSLRVLQVILAIAMTPSFSSAGANPDAVNQFKKFLSTTPSVKKIVFGYVSPVVGLPHGTKNPHESHDGGSHGEMTFSTNYFHASIGQNGFFMRQIATPESYDTKTQRSFGTPSVFVGRYGETHYQVYQGLIFEEAPGEATNNQTILSQAGVHKDILRGCLSLGVWALDEKSLQWTENDFRFQSDLGLISGDPRINRSGRILVSEDRVVGISVDGGAIAIEYDYEGRLLPRGVPDKIVVRSNGSLLYGFTIFDLEVTESVSSIEHFKPDGLVEPETHYRASYDEKHRYRIQNKAAAAAYMNSLVTHEKQAGQSPFRRFLVLFVLSLVLLSPLLFAFRSGKQKQIKRKGSE